jgi:hypothetical protein
MAKADTISIGIALDCHRTVEVQLETGPGDLLELARGDHLGQHHRGGFKRLDFVLAVLPVRLVLDDENPQRPAGPEDRHAEEGVVDLLTCFRQIGKGGVGLGVRKIERTRACRNGADQALTHFQLRQMDRILVQALRGEQFQGAVGAQHIE